jgi:hypothetical protein
MGTLLSQEAKIPAEASTHKTHSHQTGSPSPKVHFEDRRHIEEHLHSDMSEKTKDSSKLHDSVPHGPGVLPATSAGLAHAMQDSSLDSTHATTKERHYPPWATPPDDSKAVLHYPIRNAGRSAPISHEAREPVKHPITSISHDASSPKPTDIFSYPFHEIHGVTLQEYGQFLADHAKSPFNTSAEIHPSLPSDPLSLKVQDNLKKTAINAARWLEVKQGLYIQHKLASASTERARLSGKISSNPGLIKAWAAKRRLAQLMTRMDKYHSKMEDQRNLRLVQAESYPRPSR